MEALFTETLELNIVLSDEQLAKENCVEASDENLDEIRADIDSYIANANTPFTRHTAFATYPKWIHPATVIFHPMDEREVADRSNGSLTIFLPETVYIRRIKYNLKYNTLDNLIPLYNLNSKVISHMITLSNLKFTKNAITNETNVECTLKVYYDTPF